MKLIQTLREWARRVKQDGLTLWFAGKNPRTPWYAKAIGLFVVAYALSPIDLIPDFIPVLGYIDDVLLLPGLIWIALKLMPKDVLGESREMADRWLISQASKPKSTFGALLIVTIWMLMAWVLWIWWMQ